MNVLPLRGKIEAPDQFLLVSQRVVTTGACAGTHFVLMKKREAQFLKVIAREFFDERVERLFFQQRRILGVDNRAWRFGWLRLVILCTCLRKWPCHQTCRCALDEASAFHGERLLPGLRGLNYVNHSCFAAATAAAYFECITTELVVDAGSCSVFAMLSFCGTSIPLNTLYARLRPPTESLG